MLNDAHGVIGIIVGKLLAQDVQINHEFAVKIAGLPVGALLLRAVGGTSTEKVFGLLGAIFGNFPDIDAILGPIAGGHSRFHRTATHSIVCNAVLVPVLAAVLTRVSGISLARALGLVSAGIGSHLLSDWITNYGTALLFPLNRRSYSLGVITVLDFPSLALVYAAGIFQRHARLRAATVLLFAVWPLYLVWRRSRVYRAEQVLTKQGFIAAEEQHSPKDQAAWRMWLQPLNWSVNRVYLVAMHSTTHDIRHIGTIVDDKVTMMDAACARKASYSVCPPRSFVPALLRGTWTGKHCKSLGREMIAESIPSFAVAALYHTIVFNSNA